ncbi:MAG TPA: ABC transporter permease [Phototrophicaceae bacterium]|nr:ABC transporter permease [Phototrophicaceae bacterium]
MARWLERFLAAVATIWLVATLSFWALRVLPGDAIQTQLMQSGASEALIAARREQQGLNQPIFAQYTQFLRNLLRGDFGYSLLDGQAVTEMIAQRLAPTAALATGAILLAVVLGITLGVVSAWPGWLATWARLIIGLALSIPIYWTGTLAILIFAVWLGWLPSAGGDNLAGWLLPVAVLGFHTGGSIARVVETQIRETLAADFVRTAHAKGLPKILVLRRHVLRVGLLPTITVIALQFGFLLGGTVITESLFVRPGLGRLLLDSALQQDYPVVQGITVLLAAIYTLVNLIADLLYAVFDPRVAVVE